MQFDNSDEANGKRLTLQDQLRTAQEQKDKTQNDYSTKVQTEALDQQLQNYKDSIDAQEKALDDMQKKQDQIYADDIKKYDQQIADKIKQLDDYQKAQDAIYANDIKVATDTEQAKEKVIDDYLNKTGLITADAIAKLQEKSGTWYDQLAKWNLEYGSGVDDLKQKWLDAITEMQDYANQAQTIQNGWTGPVYTGISLHDSGGWVSDTPTLDSQHKFGILMNTEYVSTPQQIDAFMKTTLPNIVASAKNLGGANGDISFSMPITIQGNADKDILDNMVNEVMSKVNTVMNQFGYMRSVRSV